MFYTLTIRLFMGIAISSCLILPILSYIQHPQSHYISKRLLFCIILAFLLCLLNSLIEVGQDWPRKIYPCIWKDGHASVTLEDRMVCTFVFFLGRVLSLCVILKVLYGKPVMTRDIERSSWVRRHTCTDQKQISKGYSTPAVVSLAVSEWLSVMS